MWILERTDPSEQMEEQKHPRWEKQCEQRLVSDVEDDVGGGIFSYDKKLQSPSLLT